jgi:hypothetical protein
MRIRVIEASHHDLACPLFITIVRDERAVVRTDGQRRSRKPCGNDSAKKRSQAHDASELRETGAIVRRRTGVGK